LIHFLSQAPAPSEFYALSLHDALPISGSWAVSPVQSPQRAGAWLSSQPREAAAQTSVRSVPTAGSQLPSAKGTQLLPISWRPAADRKSTRLNSSHVKISYAVFCLKKKK